MAAHAIAVLCPKRPDLMGQPLLGHVAWGFELPNGEWMIGAVEGDGWRHGNGLNGFWSRRMPDLRRALQYFADMQFRDAEYNYYKLLRVTDEVYPDPDGAMGVMRWVSGQKYELFGRNCMNSAYDILRAFSRGGHFNQRTLPAPQFNWIPNGWFNAIQVPDSDFNYLPRPSSFRGFAEADHADGLDDVMPVVPEWRVKGSADFMNIDAKQSELSPKDIVVPALPTHAESPDLAESEESEQV
ncbi:MAG: hypothetical protein VXZ05_03125 [Pseudomonadota bacterium]|nr:hypothetical protein [Pseudomonadota bacterium]